MEVLESNRGKRTHIIRILDARTFKSKSFSIRAKRSLDFLKARILDCFEEKKS